MIGIGEIRLPELFERLNRTVVGSAEANVPFVALEIAKRNSGIVLNDDLAAGEKKITRILKSAFVHQIRRGFEQAHPGTLFFAKLDEARRRFDPIVRNVGAKIVKRLLASAGFRENDLNAGRFAFIRLQNVSILVERDERCGLNRRARASNEDVENRQCSVQLRLRDVDSELFRNEKTPAQHRIE